MQDIKRTIEAPANKKRKAETGEGIPAGGEAKPESPPAIAVDAKPPSQALSEEGAKQGAEA
eukprot:6377763-Pyramimonas_sp.AAC.1